MGTAQSNLTLGEKIGEGAFGGVYALKRNGVATNLCIKLLGSVSVHDLQKEAHIPRLLNHPNILSPVFHLFDSRIPSIIMERAKYSLEDLIRTVRQNRRKVEPAHALHIFQDIANGLSFAHSKYVVHRDLKPANILLFADGAKIGDFGLARFISSEPMTVCGTPGYMAPEVQNALMSGISHIPCDFSAADVYSCGRTFLRLLEVISFSFFLNILNNF